MVRNHLTKLDSEADDYHVTPTLGRALDRDAKGGKLYQLAFPSEQLMITSLIVPPRLQDGRSQPIRATQDDVAARNLHVTHPGQDLVHLSNAMEGHSSTVSLVLLYNSCDVSNKRDEYIALVKMCREISLMARKCIRIPNTASAIISEHLRSLRLNRFYCKKGSLRIGTSHDTPLTRRRAP